MELLLSLLVLYARILDTSRNFMLSGSKEQVLTAELGSFFQGISFPKTMRWNSHAAFSRPVRWLLALHGQTKLPFAFAGLQAGGLTKGLREYGNIRVESQNDYWAGLQAQSIVVNREERKQAIWEASEAAAREQGGSLHASCREDLLDEVTDLVEAPSVLLGRFDQSFLALPQEILILVMRKHQRYFSITDASGKLLPFFIAVANGHIDSELVRTGNEAVLQARFQDAAFFYKNDLANRLSDLRSALGAISVQQDLGSMLDKSNRVEALVIDLARMTGHPEAECLSKQAASFAKADLASAVVTELPALAGIMGRHYALQEGLDPAVAEAIYESNLPRHAGDSLPLTTPGALCAIADRLDSLVGLFGAGHSPSASTDVYGLRRTAYGLLETVLHNGLQIDLREAVKIAASLQPIVIDEQTKTNVLEFISRRLEQLIIDQGVMVEAARAVLNERSHNAVLASASANYLQEEYDKGASGMLQRVAAMLSRPVRIARGKFIDGSAPILEALFETKEEQELHQAWCAASKQVTGDMSIKDFLKVAIMLEPFISAFFDEVFVMCDDERIRNNRLALLHRVGGISQNIVDLTALPGV